jgi:hypothetical protein
LWGLARLVVVDCSFNLLPFLFFPVLCPLFFMNSVSKLFFSFLIKKHAMHMLKKKKWSLHFFSLPSSITAVPHQQKVANK